MAKKSRKNTKNPPRPREAPRPPASSDCPQAPLWKHLTVLFFAALTIRWLVQWQLSSMPSWNTPIGDGESYFHWATRIAQGEGFGRAVFYQAPLYPYLLSLIQRVFGPDLVAIRSVQAVLGSVSCLFLAVAVGRMVNPRAGLAAGWMWAIYAPAIYFDALIQKTSVALALLAFSLFLITEIRVGRRLIACGGLGLTLAGLMLVRENALLLVPFVLLWTWLSVEKGRPRYLAVSLILLCLTLPLFGVAARNRVMGGEWVITTSQFGPNFYIGNHHGADGRYQPLKWGRSDWKYERKDAEEQARRETGQDLTPRQVSRFWFLKALGEIADHPLDWTQLMARKSLMVMLAQEIPDTEDIYTYREFSFILDGLHRVAHFGTLLALAVMGFWIGGKRWQTHWIVPAMGLVYAASVVLFFVFDRYRFPLAALILPAAALALSTLIQEKAPALQHRRTAILLALMVFAVSAYPLYSIRVFKANSYLNFGQVLASQGELDRAQEFMDRAAELDPGRAQIKVKRANNLIQRGQIAQAEVLLKEALAARADQPTALAQLGLVHLMKGDDAQAVQDFQRSLELDPKQPQVLNNLAWLAVHRPELGLAPEAQSWAERACQLTQYGEPGHLDTLADTLWANGNQQAAIETADRMLKLLKTGDPKALQQAREKRQRIQRGDAFQPQSP